MDLEEGQRARAVQYGEESLVPAISATNFVPSVTVNILVPTA